MPFLYGSRTFFVYVLSPCVNTLDAPTSAMPTPFHVPSRNSSTFNDPKTNKQLLKAGADPTLKASTGWGPLGAVIAGDRTKASPTLGPPLIRTLVAAGANADDVHGPDGLAPLHFACLNGACGEVVQALLDAGADACAPCPGSVLYAGMHFMTPLQLAAAGGNTGAVAVLIGQPGYYGGLNAVGTSPSRCVWSYQGYFDEGDRREVLCAMHIRVSVSGVCNG